MTAAPLSYTQTELPPQQNGARRRKRYMLHNEAAKLVGGRVGRCGHYALGGTVSVRQAATKAAYYSGVETCGSIWACPKCAPRIAEPRRAEVAQAVDLHTRAGGSVYMAAFTIPHGIHQRCKPLKDAVTKTWGRVLQGKAWGKIKGRYKLQHMVRSLEVTYGRNGWHPHLHVLFFFEDGVDQARAEEFGFLVFERWARYVAAAGLGDCNPDVFKFEKARDVQRAGEYVAKWGSDREICFGHLKQGKMGGKSPWQLLADSAAGDVKAGQRFKEFAAAFFRARHLTWTRGTKEHFGLVEKSDDDLSTAEEAAARTVATVPADVFRQMAYERALPQLLEAAERGGKSEVETFIQNWRRRRYEKQKTSGRRGDPPGARGGRPDNPCPGGSPGHGGSLSSQH